MDQSELRRELIVAGISCRVKGDEVQIETCIFCGSPKWKLELSADRGVFHCWVCRSGGRLDAILSKITGGAYHLPVTLQGKPQARPVQQVEEFRSLPIAEARAAALYLSRRGIQPDVAAWYGLRLCQQSGHRLDGRIVIPARDFWTGEILGWVGRAYCGGGPKYLSTMVRRVVTGWRVRSPTVPTVLVEGPFDGIAVHRAGFHAAVLGGTGAPDLEEFASRLSSNTMVVVMLDADAVSQATRLYWQIQQVHSAVQLIYLPSNTDPADLSPQTISHLVHQRVPGSGPQGTI